MIFPIKINVVENHSSMFSSAKCENCGASFKPFNQYCEYCGSERPYTYPEIRLEPNQIDYTHSYSTLTGSKARCYSLGET
jgi:uncharacterized OB-fold protein